MKRKAACFVILSLLFAGIEPALAQSNFQPDAYMEFRADHRNYTAQQLLDDHPPATTYYASRQYPAELSRIPWYDSLNRYFQFTVHEQEMLKQNYFMVSERRSSMDWAYAFISLYSSDLPLFLSSDFILSTLHNSYDAILKTLEVEFLEPNLKVLLHAMYEDVPALAGQYTDTKFKEELKDVDLYLAVALSLAEGRDFVPQLHGREDFDALMDAVKAEKMTYMKLFTAERERKLDFSQFTPRGHYNKDIHTPDGIVTLENYFRAMMWLGRIDFLLTAPPENPWEQDWKPEELRRMQVGALLLNQLLYNSGEFSRLEKHEDIISFLVGPEDNLSPGELKRLADNELAGPADLYTEENYLAFTEALNASDDYGQKIMSNFFLVDPFSTDPGKLPVSFRLLGQKFLIDSYVFSEVVFDRIVYEDEKIWRPLPDPLDAMAALGNEDALALLETEMDTYKYAANMAGLKYLIEAYDEEFWEQSLYNTWLSALRSLNPPKSSAGLPYFMQTTAWHHEKLNTQLTSWAQLRHDNILYGKQSYTGGTGCSYPYTYVEPYPAFYRKLADFAHAASDFFSATFSAGDLNSEGQIVDYYVRYEELMLKLEGIAQKELENRSISEDEITFLKTMINDFMASGPYISGWYTDLFFDVEKALSTDFTVADVHTQPTDQAGNVVGNVLHVGNGKINMGVFLVDNPCQPGQLMAFAGPVSSFHSEVQANFKRLTDQEWEDRFWQGEVTERPDWVASYLADSEGKPHPEGRALKGAMYTGTGIDPASLQKDLGYMILFPNPANDKASLRFILNRESDLHIEVYDASGRVIHRQVCENLPAAEHQVLLPVARWQKGLYLVKTMVGNRSTVRELVLQ